MPYVRQDGPIHLETGDIVAEIRASTDSLFWDDVLVWTRVKTMPLHSPSSTGVP
ncbi:hypothetical protein MYX65_08330 [Acidobacteria bacterium AH-259-L09]|nr:hypothetical protein [Acidobacteria bacterium AH-259-L09]